MTGIYLDNATAAKPSLKAVNKLKEWMEDKWAIISSPHPPGQKLLPEVGKAYDQIYRMLGASEEDSFVLTSSGTEAVNHVLWSTYVDVTRETGKNHFITSNIDEAPAIMGMSRLEHLGAVSKLVEVDASFQVTAEAVKKAITPRTALVSLSLASGLTGVVQPLEEVGALCKQRGIFFHVDVTHALGKVSMPPAGDFITFNGEQIHAPVGCGGLFMREGAGLSPFIVGGSEQASMRAGNLPLPQLIALGQAASELVDGQDEICMEQGRLRDQFEAAIVESIEGAFVVGREEERLPHISAMVFPGVNNDALMYTLGKRGVFPSFGGGQFQRIALVLEAGGMEPALAACGLSFCLSRETTEDDLERACRLIAESVDELRPMSKQLWKSKGGSHE